MTDEHSQRVATSQHEVKGVNHKQVLLTLSLTPNNNLGVW